MKNDGGAAFPDRMRTDYAGSFDLVGGMTLRDYFAARYMQAICSTPFFTDGNLMDDELAKHAYDMADAMLKAREETLNDDQARKS